MTQLSVVGRARMHAARLSPTQRCYPLNRWIFGRQGVRWGILHRDNAVTQRLRRGSQQNRGQVPRLNLGRAVSQLPVNGRLSRDDDARLERILNRTAGTGRREHAECSHRSIARNAHSTVVRRRCRRSGHHDVALWLPLGGRAKERKSYPSSPRGGNYCNKLNEQRGRIGSTREHTTKADRKISDPCQQNELLPNLRYVVLDRVNVG